VKATLAALEISCRVSWGSRESHLHVKNTVSDDLGVDRDLVGSLGQSPNDGVCGPKTGGQS